MSEPKVGDVVRAIVHNTNSEDQPADVVALVRQELLREAVRDSIAEIKASSSGDQWKIKMSKIIESGCLLNGD